MTATCRTDYVPYDNPPFYPGQRVITRGRSYEVTMVRVWRVGGWVEEPATHLPPGDYLVRVDADDHGTPSWVPSRYLMTTAQRRAGRLSQALGTHPGTAAG